MLTLPWHTAATVSLSIIPRIPFSPLFYFNKEWPDYGPGHILSLMLPLSPAHSLFVLRERPSDAHLKRLGLCP
jgi:hypothetical protein